MTYLLDGGEDEPARMKPAPRQDNFRSVGSHVGWIGGQSLPLEVDDRSSFWKKKGKMT
jgi:hypothetical protein